MTSQKTSKNIKQFICENCDFKCSKRGDYNRHLKTKKHNTYKYLQNDLQKNTYDCICGKSYKHRQSLNNHKKKCTYTPEEQTSEPDTEIQDTPSLATLLMELIETNKDLKDQIIDLASKPRTVNNNKTFNLNNFLNVQCKDAMNLSDFLETIEYTFKDLLYLGEKGFVKSVEDTFINKLGTMEQTKRPIHCTDKKRKTMIVKDEDKWEKDDDNNKIASAIKTINKKQLSAFTQHSKERPSNYLDSDFNLQTQNHMIQQMCCYTNETCCDVNKKLLGKMVDATEIKK